MVLANVDWFAEEWSLPDRQHPAVGVPVRRGPRPGSRDPPCASPVTDLLGQYVSSFNSDPDDMERRMQELGVPGSARVG